MARKGLVLGVDLGVKSVGLGLVDVDQQQIVCTAVRVFPAGVDGDFESGKDESNNKKRREARLARRQTERRGRRMRKVFRLLQERQLLPAGETHECLKELDRELAAKYPPHPGVPYTLRAKALDEALEPAELGRALYHLAQRRGFLSNRRAALKEDEEKGKVSAGIEGLEGEMRSSGARTLGEHFAGLDPEAARIRARYTHRRMYAEEFEAIWEAQAKYHRQGLTPEFRERLRAAIFFQRPLKDQRELIGACSLISSEKRAPAYALETQRFRLLEKVNNLRLNEPEARALTAGERARLADELTRIESLSYKRVKELLELPKSARFSIEEGGEKKILGNLTYARFGHALNLRWDQMPREEQEAQVGMWASAGDDEAFRSSLHECKTYSEEEVAELSKVRLPDHYMGFSLKAMRRLLPHLEAGLSTQEARKKEFPESLKPAEPVDLLPPVLEALPELRNPAVTRTLTELRKAVNELVRKYGKPDKIRVELARDLKRNKKDRQAMTKQNRENERKRDQARAALVEYGLTQPGRADIEKYLLWMECGHICPYSGRPISLDALYQTPVFDIEHIVPHARSLDDSFQNKTLCLREYNARKRNRTPWEAFSSDAAEWEEMLERVKKFGNRGKLRRFAMQETDTAKLLEKFSSNELNDTRYMSTLASKYLGMLYGGISDAGNKQRVWSCAGGVTAWLRRLWDLNRILSESLEKSRADHRHHAVDAATVAMVTQGMVQRLASASAEAEHSGQRRLRTFPEPWEGFREQLKRQILENTVVSHKPERKLAGPLHEETLYGRPHERGGKRMVHIRVPVHKLSAKDIERIVDPTVKRCVIAQLEANGGDIKRLETEPPRLQTRDGREIPVRRVRIVTVARTEAIGKGARLRHVITGDNHHMEVIAVQERGKPKYIGPAVSRLEAVRRHRAGEAVVKKAHGPDTEFLFSLSEGDMVRWKSPGDSKEELWRVRGVQDQRLTLSRATDARLKRELESTELPRPSVNVFCGSGGRKVHVSRLGGVREAHD